ncbi:hypothetical protein FB45DRAFT_1066294 [Roridomyces roridus]|uniref:DUF6534 domain-containing protein n=1 Tax=Roridomyces roridus TaxID=1738132 RepID=A0AAD7F985_9AGAR|nr:hypothetical protein FB45DRAFT_1066294 [Roridomyces roridus]
MATTSIRTTLGALLIGPFFFSLLSGISHLQAVLYFRYYKRDSIRIKLLVSGIWLLTAAHTGCVWGALWFYGIENYGEPEVMDRIPWFISVTIILTALIVVCVHCFLAHRILVFSERNWYVTIPVILLSFIRFATACVTAGKTFEYGSYAQLHLHYAWLIHFGLAASVGADIVITSVFVFVLLGHRTEAEQLKHVLDRLMLSGLGCGSLTCIGSVISLICYITMPHNLIFLAFFFSFAQLYTNTFFATLNTRNDLRVQVSLISNLTLPSSPGSGLEGIVNFEVPSSLVTLAI